MSKRFRDLVPHVERKGIESVLDWAVIHARHHTFSLQCDEDVDHYRYRSSSKLVDITVICSPTHKKQRSAILASFFVDHETETYELGVQRHLNHGIS